MWRRRNSEASERFLARREREDSAPRLKASFPALETLTFEFRETTSSGSSCPEAAHIRRIVVEHAPALFFIMCHDAYCRDGGHEISRDVLTALRQQKARVTGQSVCGGHLGSTDCNRVLHYIGTATYRLPSSG